MFAHHTKEYTRLVDIIGETYEQLNGEELAVFYAKAEWHRSRAWIAAAKESIEAEEDPRELAALFVKFGLDEHEAMEQAINLYCLATMEMKDGIEIPLWFFREKTNGLSFDEIEGL